MRKEAIWGVLFLAGMGCGRPGAVDAGRDAPSLDAPSIDASMDAAPPSNVATDVPRDVRAPDTGVHLVTRDALGRPDIKQQVQPDLSQ